MALDILPVNAGQGSTTSGQAIEVKNERYDIAANYGELTLVPRERN